MQKPGPLPTATFSSCPVVYQREEELATGPSLCVLAALGAPPRQEEAELMGSSQAHLIGLVQVLQVQVLNEVIHNVQVIVLSCQVESVHSFLKRVRVIEEGLLTSEPQKLPPPGEVRAQAPVGPTCLPGSWLSGRLQL